MIVKDLFIGFLLILSLLGCAKESSTLALDTSWADKTLQEKGVGLIHPENKVNESLDRLESYREAKMDLYKKLESDIMNLKIDVKRDVKSFIGDNQKLKDKVTGFLKGTRITEAVYTPQKGMTLSGQLYLGESFKSILGLMEKKSPDEKAPAAHPQNNSLPGKGF